MILLQLNLTLRDNYVFVDPEAPLHLSLSNPRGAAPRLTASIIRGLKGKTLIDVNGVVDLETGLLKDQKEKAAQVDKILEEAEVENSNTQEVQGNEEVEADKPAKKTTKKSAAK